MTARDVGGAPNLSTPRLFTQDGSQQADAQVVHPRHEQYVRESLPLAVDTVNGLAQGSVQVGRLLHRGEVEEGLQDFVVIVDRLHNFLNFVVLAQIYLHDRDRKTSEALNRYRLTLLGVIGTVESFLEDSDFDQLGVHLACSLSTALLDYRSVSEAVSSGVNANVAA